MSLLSTEYWTPDRLRIFLTYLAVGLTGALAGLVGTFLHPWTSFSVPWGIVVAAVLSVAAFLSGGWAVRSRRGALLAALGWAVMVAALWLPRAEGDLIFTRGTVSQLWVYGMPFLALACLLPSYDDLADPA